MLFPIIKVIDNGHEERDTRIVGTDVHDNLSVDSKTKGIHYYNLQNGEGTGEHGSYEFAGIGDGYNPDLQVEFVTFEELKAIYEAEINRKNKIEKIKNEMFSGKNFARFFEAEKNNE